jgi:hypothetical protein
MKKTLWIVAIVVLALGALGVGVAFAQGGTPPYQPYGGMGGRGMMQGGGGYGPMHDYVEQALADKLGLTEEQVEDELAAGKPMFQIALDHGIKQEDLATFMNDVHTTAFAAAVKDGVMTQAQADFMLQRMSQNGYNYGNCPMGGAGYSQGRGGMMGGRWQNQNPSP